MSPAKLGLSWLMALSGLALPWLPGWVSGGFHGWWLVAVIALGFVWAIRDTVRFASRRVSS